MDASMQAIPLQVPCPKVYHKLIELSSCQSCTYYQGHTDSGVSCDFPADSPPTQVHPKNKLNALAGNEWLYFTKSVLQTSNRPPTDRHFGASMAPTNPLS